MELIIIARTELLRLLFSTLRALYIGIFMPCNAVRLTVACKANSKLAGKYRRSRPSFLNE